MWELWVNESPSVGCSWRSCQRPKINVLFSNSFHWGETENFRTLSDKHHTSRTKTTWPLIRIQVFSIGFVVFGWCSIIWFFVDLSCGNGRGPWAFSSARPPEQKNGLVNNIVGTTNSKIFAQRPTLPVVDVSSHCDLVPFDVENLRFVVCGRFGCVVWYFDCVVALVFRIHLASGKERKLSHNNIHSHHCLPST